MPNNEWGDFQTPPDLVKLALDVLPSKTWSRVLEPTCGTGSFVRGAQMAFRGAEVLGIEVNPKHAYAAGQTAEVLRANIFELNLAKEPHFGRDGELLVIGNPPWVTNADLTALGSINKPERRNLKNLKGLDALTGASNFDIAEYIWLKLIVELADQEPTIALLCKTQVARNVLAYCSQFGIGLRSTSMHRFDAKRWFNAMVDACFFTVEVGGVGIPPCDVYDGIGDDSQLVSRMGIVGKMMVSDLDAYERSKEADGQCEFDWRQGLKHDAASVMELREEDCVLRNGADEVVDVEPDYVFPLLKSTDVFRNRPPSRRVLVPQQSLGEETNALAAAAPRLWSYLDAHGDALDSRKSSIYQGRPRFSVFGIGPYSFAPWKVAISGLHKTPVFRLVGPIDGRPVFFDDTCYLLPFDDGPTAAMVYSVLASGTARNLLESLVFWDSKRPVTKKLLSRLTLAAIIAKEDRDQLIGVAAEAYEGLAPNSDTPAWNRLFDELQHGVEAPQLSLI